MQSGHLLRNFSFCEKTTEEKFVKNLFLLDLKILKPKCGSGDSEQLLFFDWVLLCFAEPTQKYQKRTVFVMFH